MNYAKTQKGTVGDMGSDPLSITRYEISYKGQDMEKLKEFVLKVCKDRGLEVESLVEGKDGKDYIVTARVKSFKGIV